MTQHRWSRVLESLPRSRTYTALGMALALAAPAGLLIARALASGEPPILSWALADIRHLVTTYAYVTFTTVAVFALLGGALGRSYDRVRLLSITDPLTGLFNRRHFGQRMAEEVRRGWRHGHATSVICVDIDGLKAINDGFGHKVGDQAIVAVSQILLENVRGVDAVARVGGDEFAVLLPETSANQAERLSRRILKQVAGHGDGSTGNLAVSIGITELDARAEQISDDMLAGADAALYQAKAAGGGQVVVAQSEPARARSQHAAMMAAALLVDDAVRTGARK